MRNSILVGLDIGSTNTTVVIGDAHRSEGIDLIGFAKVPSQGIRRGIVVNIDALLSTVSDAIDQAEQVAGYEVEDVIVAIGGGHVQGLNSRGIREIEGKIRYQKNEITQEDVDKAVELAESIYIPSDRTVLDIYPQFFTVDGVSGIRNPLGMLGKRLEVDVHIVTCASSTAQNIVKAINRAGFRVSKLVLNSISAAESALTKDEIDMGVLLIDMGGGTTNSVLIKEEALMFTHSLDIGGNEITNDLAYMLRTPLDLAEKVKQESGNCLDFLVDKSEPVMMPGVGGRPPLSVERKRIVEIIKPRVEETLSLVREHVNKRGLLQDIGAGIVLVGGGALLPGVAEISEEVFGIIARIGQPANHGGATDIYRTADHSTAVGLIQVAAKEFERKDSQNIYIGNNGLIVNLKKWLRNFFE